MSSFPVGSSVLLQHLVKGAQYNDKKGIVKSPPVVTTGRQEVYVFEANKSLLLKPANLRYEPRTVASLSVSEMKGMLRVAKKIDSFVGMDKADLREMVREILTDADDEVEIAGLVAKANEPKEIPPPNASSAVPSGGGGASTSQLRQGAERMSQMSPDDIRKQAATMKAMGPAALRAMNPQMARMSDAQINMAIAQMEAVANNPDQLKMAADQMKDMSDDQLKQAVETSPLTSGPMSGATPSSSTAAPSAPAMGNISKSQFQMATQQMSSMTPEQLKQQAAMLKSMPLDTLRRTNPQMAGMSDAQIQASIAQLEQMAENPALVKMAADQMKNMTEEQYEGMRNMAGGLGAGGGGAAVGGTSSATAAPAGSGNATTGTGNEAASPAMPADPSKMMEALLSSPEQLNSIIKTMKSNPDLMKSMMVGQMGEGKSDAQKQQMEKAIDSFAEMDDAQLERYLKVANGVQKVAKPVLTVFDKTKKTLGVSTKALVVLINVALLAFLVMLARWWRSRGGDDDIGTGDDVLATDEPPEIVAGYDEGEF